MRRRQLYLAAILTAAWGMAIAYAQQSPPPDMTVTTMSREMADAIEARHAEFQQNIEGLYEVIDELLLPEFDFETISKAILAEHWEPATDEQRGRFLSAFWNYLVASYGDLFMFFDHSSIRTLAFDGELHDDLPVTVNSILTLSNGTEVDLEFVMVSSEGDWKIVDVIASGIAYVRTYRSQFRIQIAAQNIDDVIAWLDARAAARFDAGASASRAKIE